MSPFKFLTIVLPGRRIVLILKILLFISVLSFFYLAYSLFQVDKKFIRRNPPKILTPYVCPYLKNDSTTTVLLQPHYAIFPTSFLFKDLRVLLLVEAKSSKHGNEIIRILDTLRIDWKIEVASSNQPSLTNGLRGRFSLIIFENYYKYVNLPMRSRRVFDDYCSTYGVGIISFIESRSNGYKRDTIKNTSLFFTQRESAKYLHITYESKLAYFLKSGAVLKSPSPDNNDWVLFDIEGFYPFVSVEDSKGNQRAAVIYDDGKVDGVHRILFGHNFTHWIIKLAFMDSLRYLSEGLVDTSLDRYIQIDIDDVFIGSAGHHGTKIIESDADAILASQTHLRGKIENFTYTLGFTGGFFQKGDFLERRGDERLIELAKNFLWFPHLWRHNHVNKYDEADLETFMKRNKAFAEEMGLRILTGYAIAPQHRGVYPVHDPLYTTWKSVWNITVTATDRYPYQRPALSRRGFTHRNISVLPRHYCGLYTHTHFFRLYPRGYSNLIANIEGGELFFSIFFVQFSMFITHQQNYANDRLAIFTFERVVDFIQCWTNLRLKWMEPVQSAEAYFRKFPLEKMPVWSNPCTNPHHVEILPMFYNCSDMALPNLLIVGPQKTGSTALHAYLAVHPNFITNDPIATSFEELQFFGGANYYRGISWYMRNFQPKLSTAHSIIFEKSATYFDSVHAPRTASALLPNAAIVVILLDPCIRAYSWYQHMRAHGYPIALSHSLGAILETNSSASANMKKARSRIISPGKYAHHLMRWLEYFPSSQIHVVDGDEVRQKLAHVLNNIVAFVHGPSFNFEEVLVFDNRKGFFCLQTNGRRKCLGGSKGRKYDPIDSHLYAKLDEIYHNDSIALHRLLMQIGKPVPNWLHVKFSDA